MNTTMGVNIINLTPHSVMLKYADNDGLHTIEPSGTIARCVATTEVVGLINGLFNETRTVYGSVTDLPEPQPNTLYIVSSLVALALPKRHDLRIPNESIRDEAGRIVGCKSLGRVDDETD